MWYQPNPAAENTSFGNVSFGNASFGNPFIDNSALSFRAPAPHQMYIVSSERGDVNGDKIADDVYLTGYRTPASPFVQHIQLHIKDGATGHIYTVPLKENTGYNPTVFLGDFTGDGIADILINIDSGGSGAFTYDSLFSFVNNQPRLLYDNDWFMKTYSAGTKVTFENGYKVRVVNRSLRKEYILDISLRDREYLNELYDANGVLKKPVSGDVQVVSGTYPIDLQRDGVYELWPFQRITGLYNADGLGDLQTPLSWDQRQNRFVPMYQLASVFGQDLK